MFACFVCKATKQNQPKISKVFHLPKKTKTNSPTKNFRKRYNTHIAPHSLCVICDVLLFFRRPTTNHPNPEVNEDAPNSMDNPFCVAGQLENRFSLGWSPAGQQQNGIFRGKTTKLYRNSVLTPSFHWPRYFPATFDSGNPL